MSTPGRGRALSLSRTYASALAGQDGLFGHGWTSSYGMSLLTDTSSGNVALNQENGSQVVFTPGSGTAYVPAQPRELATLVHNSDGSWTFTRNKRDSYVFNSAGQLIAEQDLNGYVTTFAYDSAGHLALVTDPEGRTDTITTASGRITQISDPAGQHWVYAYNSAGDLTDVTDPTTAQWSFSYDSAHRLLSMLDPNQQGAATPTPLTNVYDSSGRVTSQTDAAGRTTAFDYTSITGATKVTDPAGHVTVDYYTNGLRTKTTAGYGTSDAASTNYTYDPTTEATASVQDPNGHTTSYTYDARGNQLTATDPLSRVTTSTYDSLNDLLTVTDALNVTTTNTYDSNGNLLSTSTPLLSGTGTVLATRTVTYTRATPSHPDDVTAMTDPNGNTSHYTYDTDSDMLTTTAPPTPENSAGNKTSYAYDTTAGRRTSSIAPKGNLTGATPADYTTTYLYDADGRPLHTRDAQWSAATPTVHQVSTTYDLNGNTTSSTDANGRTTSYAYDRDNELTLTTQADTTTLGQTWTADGLLHTRTDAAGHTTTYADDNRNDLASVATPLGKTTAYTYDLNGNVTLKTDPGISCTTLVAGCTSVAYDNDNEPTARQYHDTNTPDVTAISYDADGRRTGQTDATGTSTWTYDSLDRLTSSLDGHGTTTSYTYDLNGNKLTTTYPGSGHTATNTYDAANRLATTSDWLSNTATFSYDANSNPVGTALPSSTGEADATTYNNLDELTGISDTKTVSGTPTTLAGFAYTRDPGGQLATDTTTGTGITAPSQTYGYNSLEQLTASGSGATPTSYAYTAANNINNRGTTSGGSASTLAYNSDDQPCWSSPTTVTTPACATVPAGATTYTYDANGDRTQASTPGTPGTPAALAIDVTTSKDSNTSAATVTTNSFSTTTADTLIALVSADGPSTGGQTDPVAGAGLTWTLVSRANSQAGDTEIWTATATSALTNVTVHATEALTGNYHQALTVVALKGAGGVGASAHASAATGAPTVSLTTTAAGSMIFASGMDWDSSTTRTLASGQTLIHEYASINTGDDFWSQRRSSAVTTAGTSITMADTAPTADRWNLAAVEITPATTGGTPATTQNYTYNRAHQLTTYTNPAGTTTAYSYDGDGLRASKTTGASTTNFTWDKTDGLPQLLSDGTNSYLYGPNGQPLEQISTSGTITWLHHDQLGSTRLLTDNTGTVVGTYTYDPYGTQTSHTGTTATPLGYTGQYTDTGSGLLYLRERYYDSITAQLLTIDPAIATTNQPYAYADLGPTNGTDPSGLMCWSAGCLHHDASVVGGHVVHAVNIAVAATPQAQLLIGASEVTGKSFGLCGGGDYNVGFDVPATLCWQATPSGDNGFTATAGYGIGGIAVNGFVGVSVSNANNLSDFSQGFTYVGAGTGEGLESGGGLFSWGTNCAGRNIWQTQLGWTPGTHLGPSGPISVSGGRSWTWIGR